MFPISYTSIKSVYAHKTDIVSVCSLQCFAPCSELEQYVGSLQKDSTATHRAVTLKDVEEGAVTLRKVGESLAGLKGKTADSTDTPVNACQGRRKVLWRLLPH